jgi:hypothetical protein
VPTQAVVACFVIELPCVVDILMYLLLSGFGDVAYE